MHWPRPSAPGPEPLGDAAIVDLEPPPSPPARNEALVQVFADWLERHPIGSPLDPAEARLLEIADLPASLPALPLGRSYAEVDGMIVELDLETGELLRLVRRAPVLAEVPQPPVVVPDVVPEVSQADDEERRLEEAEAVRERAALDAVERAEEEREEEAAERELEERERELREEAAREAAVLAEERERLEEQARQAAERELEERARRAEEEAREAAARAEAERERAEALARELAEQERDEDWRGEAQAFDIPNGHLPPPGSCRVWFPDRPPGQQPPPTSCNVEVPPGAVLIRR